MSVCDLMEGVAWVEVTLHARRSGEESHGDPVPVKETKQKSGGDGDDAETVIQVIFHTTEAKAHTEEGYLWEYYHVIWVKGNTNVK